MKQLLKTLIVFFALALPLVIFAQTTPTSSSNQSTSTFSPMGQNTSGNTLSAAVQSNTAAIFNLPVTDPSLNFLGQLFGTVGPVLHGTSGQLMGTLFQYFNLGILMVSGIFLFWTIMKVLIHSSQEGTFMSKEVNAGFHIIRTILGIGLLAPSAAGYSIIQIIVMWAVLQGAGFANTAWDAALDYFEHGGQLLVSPSTSITPILNMSGTVLEANLCMYYHEKLETDLQIDAKAQIAGGNTAPIFTSRAAFFPAYTPSVNATAMTISFPANRGNSPTDAGCGIISWAQPVPPSNSSLPVATQQANNNAFAAQALQQVITSLSTVARQMVYSSSTLQGQVAAPSGTGTISQMESIVQLAVVGAAQDFVNLTGPIRSSASSPGVLSSFYTQARQDGWIYAGSYYYQLASVQRAVGATSDVKVHLTGPPTCMQPTSGNYMTFPGVGLTDCSAVNNSYKSTGTPQPSFENLYQTAATYVGNSVNLANTIQQSNAGNPQATTVSFGGSHTMLDALIGGLTSSISDSLHLLQSPADPILKVQLMGVGLIDEAINAWIGFAIGYFFVSLLASMMSSMSSIGFAIRDMIFFFVPMFIAILGVVLAQGILCVVYVPLIPFIIYTFTAIGWLIHVIEAMVAAPLVALGVTHPEGQGLMGKGEQAIMLLLGVFLRPVCMILGLLAGMLLSYIALQMLNYPIVNVINNIVQFAFNPAVMLGITSGIVGIYVVLVIQIVTQSYSLIFNVPDRVLRWLGQQVEASGAAQALQSAEAHGKAVGDSAAKGMQMPSGGGSPGGGGGDEGGGDDSGGTEAVV